MHVTFLNPQGNFDPLDSHLTEHPDFGGQLVYVKEVAWAMATAGHDVDIVTRRMEDPDWPEFSAAIEQYPGAPDRLRIVRVECGGLNFLPKEQLWPHLDEFVANLLGFYGDALPDFATAHYADGGFCGVALARQTGIGFTFTGHSLGAQKMDKLGMSPGNAVALEDRFHFSARIAAERLAMEHAHQIITSTGQERREQYSHPLYAGAVDVTDDGRFTVIPPGVNTSIFTTEPGEADRTHADGLLAPVRASTKPMVIVSNRLDTKKNTLGVVQAFAASEALRSAASLVLCFRGIDDPFAEIGRLDPAEQEVLAPMLAAIDEAGMRDDVHFLNIPSQGALAATYRAVAAGGGVFALTAFYEPFGLAPIEAAACGLACVATRNGGPSEIFEDGSGVLVDPADPADIARGLLAALENQPDLAARARQRVLSTYTWEMTAERYAEVIDAVRQRRADVPPAAPLDAGGRITEYLASGGAG